MKKKIDVVWFILHQKKSLVTNGVKNFLPNFENLFLKYCLWKHYRSLVLWEKTNSVYEKMGFRQPRMNVEYPRFIKINKSLEKFFKTHSGRCWYVEKYVPAVWQGQQWIHLLEGFYLWYSVWIIQMIFSLNSGSRNRFKFAWVLSVKNLAWRNYEIFWRRWERRDRFWRVLRHVWVSQ